MSLFGQCPKVFLLLKQFQIKELLNRHLECHIRGAWSGKYLFRKEERSAFYILQLLLEYFFGSTWEFGLDADLSVQKQC